MFRRGFFRSFKKILKADEALLRQLIETGNKAWTPYKDVVDWALKSAALYDNRKQRQPKTSKTKKNALE